MGKSSLFKFVGESLRAMAVCIFIMSMWLGFCYAIQQLCVALEWLP